LNVGARKTLLLINYLLPCPHSFNFASFFFFLVVTAQTQVNRNGPETPLKFITENPGYLFPSTQKNTPTYLNCHVQLKIDSDLMKDLRTTKFYQDDGDENSDDDDDDDHDEDVVHSEDDIRKLYEKQYKTHSKIKGESESGQAINATDKKRVVRGAYWNEPNDSLEADADETEEEDSIIISSVEVQQLYRRQMQIQNSKIQQRKDVAKQRSRRSLRGQLPKTFEWFRDDEKVISLTNDGNPSINLNEYTLFSNGTLKFQASNTTAGEYRCKAKHVDRDGKFVIGPIISQATVVEIASKFHK